MAMWFSHLRYVEAAAERLAHPMDRLALCWGSLCCDVDKISPVPRAVSHYGREGLDFAPERFLETAGLTTAQGLAAADFLAGYLSHMAVDEAWYRHLFGLRDREPGLATAWTPSTTRALNLALDQRNRGLYDPAGLDFRQAGGEAVLPHLQGPVRRAMVHAACVYVGWTGDLGWEPADPVLSPMMASFRHLSAAEAPTVQEILGLLDPLRLDAEVVAFTAGALGRFLDDLSRRPASP